MKTTRKKTYRTVVLENVNTGTHVILKKMVWVNSLGDKKMGWFRHGKCVNPRWNRGNQTCTITTHRGGRVRRTEYNIIENSER